jgi:hypothetical protein
LHGDEVEHPVPDLHRSGPTIGEQPETATSATSRGTSDRA